MKRDFVSPLPSSESVAGASGVLVPQILVEEPARHLEALGEASSHPRFAIRRLAVFQLACVGLAGLLIGAMALIWLISFRPDGIIDAVLRFPEWFDSQARKVVVISVVLGFFLSALLAGTLQIRGSFWGALAERKGGSGLLGKSVAGAVFLCFAAGLPYIVASQSSWRFALLIDLVALAPLPLLVAAMEWGIAAQRDESPGSRTTRLTVTIGMIGLVVAPFIVFQLASGFLRVDFAKWVASYSSAIDLSAFVEAGALKSSAPAWLREIADGKFGEQAASLLKSAIATVSAGADGGRALIDSVAAAISAPLERVARLLSLILLLPAVALVVGHAVYITWVVRASAKDADPTADDEAAKSNGETAAEQRSGCIGRLLALLLSPFRRKDAEQPEEAASGSASDMRAPDWVESMLELQRSGSFAAVESMDMALERDEQGTSAHLEGDAYDWLFGGVRPTADQHRALVALRDRFEVYLREQEQVGFGGNDHVHPDFFLESKPGSGATTTLVALAAYSAVARGQRVLLLKSTRKGVESTIVRLKRLLADITLSDLLSVGGLAEGEVQKWTDPTKHAKWRASRQEVAPIPDILVGTLADWERICQSEAMDRSVMRAALLGVEVVLVDDFGRGRGDMLESMHLPFVLDKHRLFLRSEFRVMQLVVAAPRLDEGSRELLAKRLFGGNGASYALPLRPWRNRGAVHVDVTARSGSLDDALKQCAEFCTSRNLRTLVYKQGADEQWMQRLRDAVPQPELIRGVADPEDIPEELKAGFSVVIYRRSLGDAPSVGIAASSGEEPPVFIRIAEPAQATRRSVDPIPVLASARSRALFFTHLRSVTAYLAPGAPVERNEWVRFGLRERGKIHELECMSGEQFTRASRAPLLLLDPPEASDGLADERITEWDGRGVWPYVVVSPESTGLERNAVELLRPVEDRARLYVTPDGRMALVGATDRTLDRRRFAVWLSPRSEEMYGELDLAHADLLRIKRGDRWFRPLRTESAKANRDSRHQIRSDFYHDEPNEPLVPVFSTSFDIEPHAIVSGPLQFGVRDVEWYAFEAARRPLVARAAVIRIADEQGNESPIGAPLEFELDVAVSVLAVGMELPESQRLDWARAYFAGGWTTKGADAAQGSEDARGFLPAMTAVLQVALREVMPDMLSFARVLAFRPPRGGRGAVIFFIEPLGTAGTAAETLQTVLSRPPLRDRLVDALKHALEVIRRTEGRLSYAPRYEGMRLKPCEADLRGIEELLERLGGGLVAAAETQWMPSGKVGVIRSPGPSDDAPWGPPERESRALGFPPDGAVARAADADFRWRDHNTVAVLGWRGDMAEIAPDERSVEYGVQFGRFSELAAQDVAAFGYSTETLRAKAAEGEDARRTYLQSVGFKEDSGVVWANYEWMIARSRTSVLPLAQRIVDQAVAAGAISRRAKISAIHSFVTSLRYEIPSDHADGKERWGVRMPTDSLERRAGDCDSMSVLFLSMVRALELASGYVVVTHDHALAALKIEIEPQDDYVETSDGCYLVVECTHDASGARRLGRVSRELIGVAVQVEY